MSVSLSASPKAATFSRDRPRYSVKNLTPDFLPASLYDISRSWLIELVMYTSSVALRILSIMFFFNSSSPTTMSILSNSWQCSSMKDTMSSLRILVFFT